MAVVSPEQQRKRLPLGGIAVVVVAVMALLWIGRQAGVTCLACCLVDSLGVWGPIVFILGYALAVVAFVPGSVLTLAGGASLVSPEVIVVFIAAVIGSCAAFLISRYVARSAVERLLAGNPKFSAIDRAVAAQGRRIVFLLRLSPVFPFTLLNYGLGLTRIRFVDYMIASIGMLPGTVLYVYYGKLAGDVANLAGGAAVEKGIGYYAVLILGLVATIVATTIVTRIARRALNEATGQGKSIVDSQ
jgi:uncharacterized membrane protein YdjX (TVP38/TMEM64 family)